MTRKKIAVVAVVLVLFFVLHCARLVSLFLNREESPRDIPVLFDSTIDDSAPSVGREDLK